MTSQKNCFIVYVSKLLIIDRITFIGMSVIEQFYHNFGYYQNAQKLTR